MNRLIFPTSLLLAAVLASSAPAGIRIVRTGTNYATVQAAASAAIDGDTIEIDSGTYVGSNGNALFTRNNLTIRGVGATRPIMDAGYTSIQGKGIWLIQGTNTTVEFIEFRNCAVPDLNGAGIRQEGATLTVRDCYFHDNENGILGGAGDISDITIENCEFAYNGFGDGQSHQIYIGTARSLTVRYCYFHHGWKGQEIKSRAKANYILYNRITCEADGYSNYEVSLCQGGESYVIGNIIHQGPLTQNKVIIDYNSDGAVNPDLHLYVINNTVVNDSTVAASSIFVRVGLPTRLVTTPAVIQNNIFQGVATHAIVQYFTSTATYSHANWTNNWHTGSSSAYLAWPFMYDYRLTAASTGAIDMGVTPGTSHTGYSLTPTHQYVHPCSSQTRPTNGTIDIGAYEYVSSPANQAPYVDAGQDQITTPPRYTVNLDATIHDDTTASPTVYWSKVSGPGAVTFADANAVDTTATFGASGTYVLQLQAIDGGGLYTTDTVTVTVNPDPALGGTITLQNGVAPDVTYVGCEDNWMTSGSPNTNYGTNDWGNGMGQYAGTRRSLIKFDVSAIPDTATVSAATIRLWMCKIQANRTLEAYQVLRPWTKLGSSWNNYASGLAWTVAGCDGAGTDRASTAAANVNVTTSQVGTWVEIPLPASLVQGWVDGTIDNYGVLLKVTSESSNEMRFWPENYVDRHGAIASRPQLVVTYDVGSPIDLRVDFGSNATNPSPNWNTVSTLVTDMAMVDYGSGSTSHGVTMTLSKTGSTINNGPTGSWNPIFPGPSWLDSSKYAVSDCLYGSWNTILYITFKNLNPSSTYTIEVVSSSSSDNDSVPWRVNGGTWTYWQAKGNGYDQGQWITWTDVTPDANNEIVVQAGNSTQVNVFLNAVRLISE